LSTFPANVTSINEGEYIAVTLNTLESSTSPRVVNYTLSQVPSSVGATDQPFDANDWLDTVTLGSGATVVANRFTLPANTTQPSTSIVFRAKNDFRVDGPKKLRLSIDDNPAIFVEFIVNDTSKEYSWTIEGPNIVNEGVLYTYNVTTTAPTGTKARIGLNPLSSDILIDDIAEINGVAYVAGTTYLVTTTNGTGTITVKFKNDLKTEGDEIFTLFLDKDITPTVRLADLGFNVTLKDTSLTPINWSFSKVTGNPTTALVREGTNMVVRIQSTNVPAYPYTIYYQIAPGNGTLDTDTNFTTGSIIAFNVTSADQQVLFQIKEDNITEGTETFQITFYRDAAGTDIITGLEWQIIDAISVERSLGFVVEGQTQTLTIKPNYLSYPYTVYGEITGGNANLTSADFISGTLLTETVLNNDNPVTLTFTGVEDYTVEGLFGEVVFFDMYSDPARTIPIGNSISWSMGDPQYVFSRSFASVNEGSNQVITISTNAVLPKILYGKMTGTNITSSDFSSPPNSTTFEWNITASGQSIGLTMAPDLTTETNPETVTLTFYHDTSFTIQAGNTVTWDIADTSKTPPPSWSFVRDPNTATVDEGVSVTVTANSSFIPSYTNLSIYYKITGTGITTEDFNLNALQGSWVIEDSSEEITFLIQADQLTEGTDSVVITFYSDSNYTTTIGNQLSFSIGDASKTTWTFARIPATGTIDEGQPISFTATPSNPLAPNTIIYYWLNGTNITTGDFTSASLEGSFNSNTGLILTMREDLFTEPFAEVAGITFYSDSNRTITIGNPLSWTIGDTSKTPPSYSLSVSATSVDEGSSFSFTIDSANVLTYPFTAYYKLSGTGITVDDTSFDPILGSVNVSGPSVSFSIDVTADQYTEGNETLTFTIYSDSNRTIQLGSPVSIVLADASKTTWSFARIPATGSINETGTNKSIAFTATPSNPAQAPITIYYWLKSVTGTILDGDFDPAGTLGSFTSNTGLTITMAADTATEGLETVEISFYTNSTRSIQIGNTLVWDVNDTSLSAPYYSVEFSSPNISNNSVNEGLAIDFSVSSSYIPLYPVTIYYKLTGTGITALDTNYALSGPIALTSAFTSYAVNILADQLTENSETLTVSIYSDAALTTQIGNTASVILNDTSKTTWSFTRSPATGSIPEGQFISFFAQPSNASSSAITVYYGITGILASDLFSGSLTGSFNSADGKDILIYADTFTDGSDETATITFYSDSNRTVQIGNTLSWVIEDTSRSPPSYRISLYDTDETYTSTLDEGYPTWIRIQSADIPSYPQKVYYRALGTGVNTSDTDLITTNTTGGIDGEFDLLSSNFIKVFSPLSDQLTENTETLVFKFYTLPTRLPANQIKFGPTVYDPETGLVGPLSKLTLTVNDTSQTTWSFTRAPIDPVKIKETGTPSSIQISATPSNPAQSPVVFYYTIIGIEASDLTSGSLTGSFVSSAGPSIAMAADSKTEGDETAVISFYKDAAKTISAGNSLSWVIDDTSVGAPTYSWTASPFTVNEGANVTISWSFGNIPDSMLPFTIYWQISGTNITANDTAEQALQGSFTIPARTGSFTLGMTADLFTEGTETVTGTFYTNAARTIQAGNSVTWNIADTSQTPYVPPVVYELYLDYPTTRATTIPRNAYYWFRVDLNKYNDTGSDITIVTEYRFDNTGAWTTYETLTIPPFYTGKTTTMAFNNNTGPLLNLNTRARSTTAGINGMPTANLSF
jgi:hypothetical protein